MPHLSRETDSALRILCSQRALRPRLKCTAALEARALRFAVFGACRGGALPEIEKCKCLFPQRCSALRILCSQRALRPRLECTAALAARALRFAVFGACRGGALPEIEKCKCLFPQRCSALRILCSQRALRPRLECTAALAARALRFAVFGACRGGALPEIEKCKCLFPRSCSSLRILCSQRALRPRLKCTAVLEARALRFAVFGACRGGALPEIEKCKCLLPRS